MFIVFWMTQTTVTLSFGPWNHTTSTVCHVTPGYNYTTMTISGPNNAIWYDMIWYDTRHLGSWWVFFFINYSLFLYLLLFIIGFWMYPNGGTSNRAQDRHISSPYRCHVTHHHYPTSRDLPLPRHTKPTTWKHTPGPNDGNTTIVRAK